MGRGRPRKTADEHLANGTYRPSRHGPLPAPVEGSAPEPPDMPAGLTADEAAAWGEIVPCVAGRVRRSDVPALVDLCRWWVRLGRMARRLDELEPAAGNYVQTLTGAGICSTNFDRLASKFGMTPADRAKLRVVDAAPPAPKVRTRPATKLDQQGKPGK